MDRATIFISDLHLNQAARETVELFSNFASTITPQTDALYILGDFFQFWGGDDDCSMFNEQIKSILKKISAKVPVYLMAGNRDFLLGQIFAQESGCTLIPDPYKIVLYGKPTLLTHGDIFCANEIKYWIFRAVIRFPYGIKIFLKLPLQIRLWLAGNIQKYSTRMKLLKNKITPTPPTDSIKRFLTKYDAKQLIHGHIHIEEIAEISTPQLKIRRISLGEWHDKRSILFYYSNHNIAFKT